ncbi:MAG: DUF6922 domain-containing protein [Minisyncoccia bacterium]
MKLNNKKLKLPLFLKPLFWSYKFSSIDPKRDKRRVIINIINYGKWKHWLWMIKFYGRKTVKKIVEESPASEFRAPALKLICLLLNIKKLKYASRSDYIRSQKNL